MILLLRWIGVALLVATLFGCHRRHHAAAPHDLGGPHWVDDIGGKRVVTTLEGTIDLDACRARPRHPLTLAPSCLGEQKAAATRFHAEIWWRWRHPCGSSVEPDIKIGERLIALAATVHGADAGAHECVSRFKSVIDPIPAQRWRIVGQDRFDVLLVVPSVVVH